MIKIFVPKNKRTEKRGELRFFDAVNCSSSHFTPLPISEHTHIKFVIQMVLMILMRNMKYFFLAQPEIWHDMTWYAFDYAHI